MIGVIPLVLSAIMAIVILIKLSNRITRFYEVLEKVNVRK